MRQHPRQPRHQVRLHAVGNLTDTINAAGGNSSCKDANRANINRLGKLHLFKKCEGALRQFTSLMFRRERYSFLKR